MYHLAQLNIAAVKYSLDDPRFKDFVDALDPVNAVADQSPGFVWRHISEEGDSATLQVYDNKRAIVNLSVWESMEDLKLFLRTTLHSGIMRRRAEWFEKMHSPYVVFWWVPMGHNPSVEEALSKLDYLREKGPTDFAFDFANSFPRPESR